jgi:L-iditol 2-dehydrogenase
MCSKITGKLIVSGIASMKAQMLTGLRAFECRQLPTPPIVHPTDVLLKIEYVGVCGSDVHYYETGRIGSQVVQYPYQVGHECSATVMQTGPAVKGLHAGQSVAVEPALPCHHCDQCLSGRPHTCRTLKFLGCPGQIPGCLSEFLVMPAECCLPIDGKITLQQGVLCEPFAIGVYAVEQSALASQMTAAILGAGPIGLSCLAAAGVQGARRVYMTEIIPERVAIAQQAGADWVGNPKSDDIVAKITSFHPEGLDVVYECAGQQETIDQALKLLKPGGTLLLIGIPREDKIYFCPDLMRRKEITVINVRRQNHCTQKAIDLVAEKKVSIDYMITHTFDFEHTAEAFELVASYRDGVVKALIKVG